jgi:predicted RNase H-like nuclease (RuvC/YqgF family)
LFSYFEEKEILLEPERQFLIEEVISGNNTINAKLKMLDTPLVLENIIPVEINDINDLKNQLQNEKRKNSDLNKIIKQLENKNKDYEQKINLLESELNQYKSKKENNEIQNASKGTQNINVLNAVLEKDKEIKELRLKLSRYPFQLEDGEKLISVIFISSDQKVHYSMICKNTTKFSIIEGKLYEEYKDYEELETYFTVNGKRINRHKSLDENQIKNNDIIMLNVVDFD